MSNLEGVVLVIDDEPGIRRVLDRTLSRDGFEVLSADGGSEGLAVLGAHAVDVVVTDLRMPGMDGIATLKMLREFYPTLQVIVMTGEPTVETAVECMKLGACEYMAKPLNIASLLMAVQRAVRTRRMEHELALHTAAQKLMTISKGQRDFLRQAAEVAETALQCDTAAIVLDQPSVREARVRSSHSWPLSHLGFETIAKRTLRLGASQSLGAYELDQILPQQGRRDFHSAVVYPLKAGETILGALVAMRSSGQPVFSGAEYRAGAVFAAQLALAVENRRLVRALEDKIRVLEDAKGRMVASERFAAIGMISSGVVHEISNPTSYVLANLGFVRMGLRKLKMYGPRLEGRAGPSPEGTWRELGGTGFLQDMLEAVEDASEGAERIRGIVTDMQALSRSETEQMSRVDLTTVVKSALRISGAGVRGAKVITELAPDLEVYGSAGLLTQVVANLVLNAGQSFTDHRNRHREIHISTRAEGGRVVLEVSDTGPGIAPEALERIFEPFFTTKPVGRGTGLGLAICRDIVARHKGHIHARSRIGDGATFRVDLPGVNQDSGEFLEVTFGGSAALSTGLPRVLLLEPVPALRRAFARIFADHLDLETAPSLEEAKQCLQDHQYDAVVCTLEADAGGLELYGYASELERGLEERFIFAWANHSAEEAPAGVPVLPQPVDCDRLLSVIRTMSLRDDAQ